VKSGPGLNGVLFRPPSEETSVDDTNRQVIDTLMSLMHECWNEESHRRPSFDVCVEYIYKFTGGKCVAVCLGMCVCK